MITGYDVLVVGTGAAGYAAACRVAQLSRKKVAIITQQVNMGTSRNTGSDKQTYYKLALGGDSADSVRKMARDLFAGGCVDGDQALCEAAASARCFLRLCELGVPFPVNRYGEYIGYKTDHDPYARATSAGPLTSRLMTEALQSWAQQLQIPVFSGQVAVQILKKENSVRGLLCLDAQSGQLTAFSCAQLVLATGGPAGIYADSVYPQGHAGSTGLAIEAGAKLQNLTLWQYGLSSTQPRWNVSGTYMQVLPRFVSRDSQGVDREFLLEHFADPYRALDMVFLKGYQWPFDSAKLLKGSSVIDLLVYREQVLRGREVFLDYRQNPFGLKELDFSRLSPEAHIYLQKAQACFGTPLQRLAKMNQPAIDLYAGKGVDLSSQMLPIALCAQHHNGGISVDAWWHTEVKGLYAVGECAGTHGITRPGGSALNAGQVGALRAAQHISVQPDAGNDEEFFCLAAQAADYHRQLCRQALSREDNVQKLLEQIRRQMSDHAAAIRDSHALRQTLSFVGQLRGKVDELAGVGAVSELYQMYRLRDHLLVQEAVLTAMADFADHCIGSCGSAIYCHKTGQLPQGLEEQFRFLPEATDGRGHIQQLQLTQRGFEVTWRPVRPLPEGEDFFETVWASYRENQNIC